MKGIKFLAIGISALFVFSFLTGALGGIFIDGSSSLPFLASDADSEQKIENSIPTAPLAPLGNVEQITLSFVGDCMLATMLGENYEGSFNAVAEQVAPTFFFEKVSDIFLQDDFTVANCENVFTDNEGLSTRYKNYSPAYWYRSPSVNAGIFKAGGIDIVSIANNHSYDYNTQGFWDTKESLERAEVEWGDDDKVIVLSKYGVKIALHCVTLYYAGREYEIAKTLKQYESETDFQIVYYHGGTERVHHPDEWRVKASHTLVDAGADLIIGTHPHVLQPIERYKGVTIVHSLGNFLFGGSVYPENRSLIYQLKLTVCCEKITSVGEELIPCYVYTGKRNNWQPALVEKGEIYDKILAFMNNRVNTPV